MLYFSGTFDKVKILVVDRDPELRSLAELILARAGYASVTGLDPAKALDSVASERPDLTLLGSESPASNTVDLVTSIVDADDQARLVLICDPGAEQGLRRRIDLPAVRNYLQKPFHPEQLLWSVNRALGM